jgi:hypothetical protein
VEDSGQYHFDSNTKNQVRDIERQCQCPQANRHVLVTGTSTTLSTNASKTCHQHNSNQLQRCFSINQLLRVRERERERERERKNAREEQVCDFVDNNPLGTVSQLSRVEKMKVMSATVSTTVLEL